MQNESRRVFVIVLALFVSTVLLTFNSYVGFANTDNVTINITVQSLTEITVTPFNITWQSITPGTLGGQRNVTVQNTGSTNATNLYAFMTTLENETASPYSASSAGDYSAGGVVVFRNSTITNMSWAGRLEWNWTEKIASTSWSGIASGINSVRAEGFVRNTTVQFYWAAANGTVDLDGANYTAYCNNTNALLAIDDDEDNGTSTTRTPATTTIVRDGGDENWSYFSVNRGASFLAGQCVALYFNCTKIYVYNYDKRTAASGYLAGTTCANANFITAGPITPSQQEKVTADVWMPKGGPAGFMKIATWTFVVAG